MVATNSPVSYSIVTVWEDVWYQVRRGDENCNEELILNDAEGDMGATDECDECFFKLVSVNSSSIGLSERTTVNCRRRMLL
jgi:hypothetical protein